MTDLEFKIKYIGLDGGAVFELNNDRYVMLNRNDALHLHGREDILELQKSSRPVLLPEHHRKFDSLDGATDYVRALSLFYTMMGFVNDYYVNSNYQIPQRELDTKVQGIKDEIKQKDYRKILESIPRLKEGGLLDYLDLDPQQIASELKERMGR